jgi:uncharacterized membrane protein
MKQVAATAHAVVAWLLVASIVGAALLSALDAAGAGGSWAVVGLAALLVVLTGVAAGGGLRRTAWAFGLLLLYFVQASSPSELQPVLTLGLFGAALLYAENCTRLLANPLMSRTNLTTSGRGK